METDSTERVLTTVADSLSVPLADVRLSSRLVELADSLEMAQLVIDLEETLHLEITDDDLKHIFTVQDIVNYANSRCTIQ